MSTPASLSSILAAPEKATDQEVNAAVARYVCGWLPCRHAEFDWQEDTPEGKVKWRGKDDCFCSDANLVLPLLDAWNSGPNDPYSIIENLSPGWRVTLSRELGHMRYEEVTDGPTFCRAVCLALVNAADDGVTAMIPLHPQQETEQP